MKEMLSDGRAMGMRHASIAYFCLSTATSLYLLPLCGVVAETNRKYMSIMEASQSATARRHYGKGIDAFNAARWEEAIGHFNNAAAEDSFYRAGALYNVALLKDASGEEDEAQDLFQEAIKISSPVSRPGGPSQYVGGGVEFAIYPMHGPCRARLGLMHARSGHFNAALEMFDGALAADPDDITSRRNGIVALHKLGRTAESSARYESLLADDPNYAQPLLEQTQVMMQPGDPGLPGSGRMERWMECDVLANPDSQFSDFELSSCRLQDGERFLIDGVLAEPTDPNAWYQLGSFYRNHDMVWDCVRAMTHALRLNGRYAQALAVMGGTLADNTNYTLSIPPLERALELHPGDLYARANIVLSNAWTCQWARNRYHIPQFIEQLQGGLDTDLKAFPAPAHMLFIIGGYSEEATEQGGKGGVGLPLLTYRRWVDMWAEEQATRIDSTMFRTRYPSHPPDNLLRVGWVSGAGFQKSPGSSAIRGVFALHDRRRFRVHCFALKPDLRANDLRGNVSGSCDVFHELGNIPNDKTLAEAVNAHQPHLIIDVSGFSGDHRIKFLAHRPAPLSITFCEYPGTLGKGTGMDLILTDSIASPPEYELIYAERMLSLPAPYLPNDYVATVAEPELARKPLPPPDDDEPPLFCALHHVWKMDETVFAVWMSVLRQVCV